MFKMISPSFLKKGDKIGIVAPARKISKIELESSFEIIRNYGLDIVYTENLFAEKYQFAGSDNVRYADLQNMLDDTSVRAVFFARGGYGSVRIIDKLNFINFVSSPKWLVGYSDITVFHNHVNRNFGIQTLHASMPINFADNTKLALGSLFDVLFGKLSNYEFETSPLNRNGIANAELVGGNLSVLYSLLGSISFPETDGKILFLEDLDEYLYHVDRMMVGLKRAGKLSNLAGFVVGSMSSMNDNIIPFGKTAEEIILDTVSEFDFPVYFGFPAGHIDDNRALVMGRNVKVGIDRGEFPYLSY